MSLDCELECSGRLRCTPVDRLSLSRERGRGEGSSKTRKRVRFANPSPLSSPLLQGERRQELRRQWREPGQSDRRRNRCLFRIGKTFRLCTAALLVAAGHTVLPANSLPIYIEDNHAGTFYWLAQNIDLDQSYTLVLFDAHSDASGIFDSDKIREVLRQVASTQDR